MKQKIQSYIETWERRCYFNGIPDEVPSEISDLVPSYKRICKAIIKNDTNLLTLGFSRDNCESYNNLKKIELIARGVKIAENKKSNQTKLDL